MFLGFVRNEEERSSIGGRRWSDNFVSTIGCKITLRVIRVRRVIEINEKFDSRWNFVRKCERDELEMEYFFFFFSPLMKYYFENGESGGYGFNWKYIDVFSG